ncbi:MAG: hypothetical protein V1728_00440 [Candidatus Micrarchaeota archaeon]
MLTGEARNGSGTQRTGAMPNASAAREAGAASDRSVAREAIAAPLPDLSQLQLPREIPVEKGHKTEWAGQIALMLSVIAFGMQLGRNWKVKKQEDISLKSWISAFFVDSAWGAYGLANELFTMVASNGLALLPRIYGIYQIMKGQAEDFRASLAWAVNEACKTLEKMAGKGYLVDSLIWAAAGDPLNTLAAAATMPAYLQFRKTMKEMKTAGISLGSQGLYTLASLFWGINGLLFGKGAVVASSLAGLYFYGAVSRAKYRQLKEDGQGVGRAIGQEAADTAKFAWEKGLKLLYWMTPMRPKQAAEQPLAVEIETD